jgi:hypothetical protein
VMLTAPATKPDGEHPLVVHVKAPLSSRT